MTTTTANVPVPFMGTAEQAKANFASHDWQTYDPFEPAECRKCMHRTYHVGASYPCGVEPARVTVEVVDHG